MLKLSHKLVYLRTVAARCGKVQLRPSMLLCDAAASLRVAAGEISAARLRHALRQTAIITQRGRADEDRGHPRARARRMPGRRLPDQMGQPRKGGGVARLPLQLRRARSGRARSQRGQRGSRDACAAGQRVRLLERRQRLVPRLRQRAVSSCVLKHGTREGDAAP